MADRILPSPRRAHLPCLGPAAWVLLAVLAAAGAAAQQPGTQPQPAKTPPWLQITGEGESQRIVLSVAERDGIPIKDFIKTAELVTGKTFTFNENDLIQADPTGGKIVFIGTQSLRKEEFFAFFQTMLYIKGLASVVRGRGNTEIIEILNLNGAKRNEITAGAVYVPPEQLPGVADQTGVNILTAVTVEHVRATAATQTLRPFFATGGAGTLNLGTAGNERVVLIQGFAPQVANAYELLKIVDQPDVVPDQEVKLVPLEHISAEELEVILKDILEDRNRPGAVPTAQGAGGGEIPGQRGPLKVLAYGARNAIILSGPRESVLEGMTIVARLDTPMEAAQEDAHVVHIRNVQAKELRDVLNQFLQEDQQAAQAAQAGQAQAPGGRRPRRTVVHAHEPSNSLLVSGTATAVDSVKRVIERLDTRQHQVLIETAIVELSTTDLTRFGIELGAIDIAANDFTRPFGFTGFGMSQLQDTDENGLPDTRLPDFENLPRGFTGGIIADDDFAVPVLINALAQDSRANILSLPSVVVNNNENASVTSAESRPTQNVSQGNATTQSGFGGFQDAGIELQISPSISSNNYLRLNITLSVSRFISAFDPSSSIPGVKVQRKVTTQVTMPSGSTMVLGGVIDDSESDTDEGVPFLKDIPILGWLFRSYSSTKSKTNLYFFLTPHILDELDFSDLSEISFRKKMEAAQYIGHRRLQMIDRSWKEPGLVERLEDSGATIEDLDRYGGFEIPSYKRPTGGNQPPLPPRQPGATGR